LHRMIIMKYPYLIYSTTCCVIILSIKSAKAFHVRLNSVPTKVFASSYGKGAEIWPECNEDPIRLADSFPNGIVPPDILDSLGTSSTKLKLEVGDRSRMPFSPKTIWSFRKRVSGSFKDRKNLSISLERTSILTASTLVILGLIHPFDVIIVIAIIGYITLLHFWAKSSREDGSTPILPSLPPQGHVPDLLLDPLGRCFKDSKIYELWIKIGFILSICAPLIVIVKNFFLTTTSAVLNKTGTRACARPLFLLCCQASVECITRRVMAPLPLRILVPLIFNSARLIPLWLWTMKATTITGKILAISNITYWVFNLFGFLIPTASMRYLRAYFLCVEAEKVVIRPGFESTIGSLPKAVEPYE